MKKTTFVQTLVQAFLLASLFIASLGCNKKKDVVIEEQASATTTTVPSQYLYIASGQCYSGSNTTFTALTSSNLVYRINLSTGLRDSIIADFYAYPSNPGDSPTGIMSFDSGALYVAVENPTTNSLRRVDKITKSSLGPRTSGLSNTSIGGAGAATAIPRYLIRTTSGDTLLTRSAGTEFITTSGVRIGAPYINPSAAPCAISNTNVVRTIQLTNGKFIFLHAAASQNRIGIMATSGGTTCLVGQLAPNVNAYPSAAFYDSVNAKLIVAYSGNATTTDLNSIYSYSIDESLNTISNAQKLYDSSAYPGTHPYLLYGVSEMYYDSTNGHVYIATAISTAATIVNYAIEKFTYAPANIGVNNSAVLTRVGLTPFYPYGNDTKCISQMIIAD